MPSLSNNNVTNFTVETFRHAWSQQLKENIEGKVFKNFEDKEFTKIRNDYAKYKKKWWDTIFSNDLYVLKEQRKTSTNTLIDIINSTTFQENILNTIKEHDSIDIYFSKLFKALLNGEIQTLSKLLFNDKCNKEYEKPFMKAISLVFGLRGKTSWLRKAVSCLFNSSKKKIACSEDMECVLTHLSIIRHSLKTPRNPSNKNPENLIPELLKLALANLDKIKKDTLSSDSDFNTLKENDIKKTNNTILIIKKRSIAELKLAILQNFYTKISSLRLSKNEGQYKKDDLLQEIRAYNYKDNYTKDIKSLWKDEKSFEEFIKDIRDIYDILDKKLDESFKKGKINIIYDYLNNEIFKVSLQCNVFTILREDLLNIITDCIKTQISFDTCINTNAYKQTLNGLFPFCSLLSDLESTIYTLIKTEYLKCIPVIGDSAFCTFELLGIKTLEDLVQKKKIESATKLAKKIIVEQEAEECEKTPSTPKRKKIDPSTEDSDGEHKFIDLEKCRVKIQSNGECIIHMSTKKALKSAIRYNSTAKKFEDEAEDEAEDEGEMSVQKKLFK